MLLESLLKFHQKNKTFRNKPDQQGGLHGENYKTLIKGKVDD